jgi:HPt (histidine-containing phosphotransfer) domain-containing protein
MVMIREESSAGDSAWSMTTELREIMDIDSDMMPELVSMFLNDSTLRMEALNSACVQRDFKSIRAQAHSLKGSSLQMGAARLATVCGALELSEKPEPDQCEQMSRAIGDEFALVRLAMEAFLVNGKSAGFGTCPSELSR